MPRVAIAAGGTAGHVVPALAVADALRARGAEVPSSARAGAPRPSSFRGGLRDRPPRRPRHRPLHRRCAPPARPPGWPSPVPAARARAARARGRRGDGRRWLRRRPGRPGGALACACRWCSPRPTATSGSPTGCSRGARGASASPSRSRAATASATWSPGARSRRDRRHGRPRRRARALRDRRPRTRCLLVFGGSQGARSINRCRARRVRAAPGAADRDFHVLHITGAPRLSRTANVLDAAGERAALHPARIRAGPRRRPRRCDLVLARAGGSVFELAAAGRPAILVPYPHATGRHQHANADWMADGGRRGGGRGRRARAGALLREPRRRAPRRPPSGCGRCRRPRWRWRARTRRSASPARSCGTIASPSDERLGRARELHFIAIGGAGMSGLALVAHAPGRRGHRLRPRRELLPRAPAARRASSHASATTPTRCPAGADVVVSTAIADDNPELVRARERGQRVIHRGELLAEVLRARRLIAVAGTHGKTTTAGMLVHGLRAIGADPAFVLGGELPGAGDGGTPANAGLGGGGVDRRRGRRVRRQLPRSCAPRSRSSPTSSSTITPAGARAPSCSARFARVRRAGAGARPGRGARPRRRWPAWRRGWSASTPTRPGPPELRLAVPGRHNRLERPRRASRRSGSPGSTPTRSPRRSRASPGCCAASSARARIEAAPSSTTTTRTTRPRSRRRLAALRELGRAGWSPCSSRTSTRGRRRWPAASARALAAADEVGVLDVYAGARGAGRRAGRGQRPRRRPRRGRPRRRARVWWLRDIDDRGARPRRAAARRRSRWSRSAPATSSSSRTRWRGRARHERTSGGRRGATTRWRG